MRYNRVFVQFDHEGALELGTFRFSALELELYSWFFFTRAGRLAQELKQLDVGGEYRMPTRGRTILRRIM